MTEIGVFNPTLNGENRPTLTTETETGRDADYSSLYEAVNSLKEELRMPVVLYYIEDFNIKEIAQILEISEGAVQKRLARARGKLKRSLQESEV